MRIRASECLPASDLHARQRGGSPTAFPKGGHSKRTAAICKLFQTELTRAFLLRDASGRLILISVPCATPIVALDKGNAEAMAQALETVRGQGLFLWQALKKEFPLQLDLATCDSSAANLLYEAHMSARAIADSGPAHSHWRLRVACEIHLLSRVVARCYGGVSSHISGMLAVALACRLA